MNSIFVDPAEHAPMIVETAVRSDVGMRMATGEWIELDRLPLSLEAVEGETVARLSGTPSAAMATGRVMRAAQTFFEVPSRSTSKAPTVARAKSATKALGNVLDRKIITAYMDRESQLMRILYKEIVLRFKPEVSAKVRSAILRESGLTLRTRNPMIPDQMILTDVEMRHPGEELVRLAARLSTLDEVAFAAPNFISQFRRSAPVAVGAPSSKQWHLRLIGATKAWQTTRGKRTITIAVLDDGIDVEHPELRGNILRNADPDEPRDVCGRDFYLLDEDVDHFNPRPKRFRSPFEQMSGNDIHGTCCAGIAVGRGPRAYGLAPNCRLLPVKIFHADDLASESQVADAIRYAAAFSDVISCSWSCAKSPDIEFALEDARRLGRKGRGTVIVCSTGNIESPHESTRVTYPASDPNVIAVGASTDADTFADYSKRGPQVCVVAPSSGGARSIFTTDVSIPGRGFNNSGADSLFVSDFGGTSSATPLVAGLCGLILSLKPEMTADDVRAALIASARKIGPASAYKANGHSNKFGYGRIDAAKAVAQVKALKAKSKKPAPNN